MPVPVQKDPDKHRQWCSVSEREPSDIPGISDQPRVDILKTPDGIARFRWEVALNPEEWERVKRRSEAMSRVAPVLPYRRAQLQPAQEGRKRPQRTALVQHPQETQADPEIIQYYRNHPHGRLDLVIAPDDAMEGRKKILQIQLRHGQLLPEGHMIAPAVGILRQITETQRRGLGRTKLLQYQGQTIMDMSGITYDDGYEMVGEPRYGASARLNFARYAETTPAWLC